MAPLLDSTTSLHTCQVSAVQVSPTEVVVECHKTGMIHSIKTDVNIKGVFVTKVGGVWRLQWCFLMAAVVLQEHLAVWSGKKVAVHSFSQDKPQTRVAGTNSVNVCVRMYTCMCVCFCVMRVCLYVYVCVCYV